MKRAELIPGEEYLYGRTDDWASRLNRVERVLVLDDRPWTRHRFGGMQTVNAITATGERQVPDSFGPATTGNGVLGMLLDQDTGEPRKALSIQVFQLAGFREGWASGWARVQETVERQRQREERKKAEREVRNAEANRLADLLGGSAAMLNLYGSANAVTLTIEQAQALVDRLGAQ